MSRHFVAFTLLAVSIVGSACSSNKTTDPGTTPSATSIFNTALLPANEVPAITNADATGSGTVTLTLHLTRDSAQQITAATGDFVVNLTGFPAGTNLTGAHIHTGASGATGGIIVQTGLASGDVVLANGTGGFTKTNITVAADVAQNILNNPAGFYFNVHTTLNAGGAVRGQLVKTQ